MTQHLKSKIVTISFKQWEYELFKEFAESLLSKKNPRQNKNAYFLLSSQVPSDTIYLTSFLKARYRYDDHASLITKYNFITGEIKRLSINHFYNLLTLLQQKGYTELDAHQLFLNVEEAGKLSNTLQQKTTVNETADFIKNLL